MKLQLYIMTIEIPSVFFIFNPYYLSYRYLRLCNTRYFNPRVIIFKHPKVVEHNCDQYQRMPEVVAVSLNN